MPSSFCKLLEERNEGELLGQSNQKILQNVSVYEARPEGSWYNEILFVRALRKEHRHTCSVLTILASILVQALSIPRDCTRKLLYGENHSLYFFTNQRTTQVYCCHADLERDLLDELTNKSFRFRFEQVNHQLDEKNYEQYTEAIFRSTHPFLIWESIFPDGIDMEALSPRDVNLHMKSKPPALKPKPLSKFTQKEKDHPPPPPPEVREPPSSDRKYGAIYQTGNCLGKGGFAICYEAQLAGTKKRYALKIVKSYMPQKKMEQKVGFTDI